MVISPSLVCNNTFCPEFLVTSVFAVVFDLEADSLFISFLTTGLLVFSSFAAWLLQAAKAKIAKTEIKNSFLIFTIINLKFKKNDDFIKEFANNGIFFQWLNIGLHEVHINY